MGTTLKNIILGMIAGVIAAVTTHELIKYFLHDASIISASWELAPADTNTIAAGIPRLANAAIWGGIWGGLFALMLGNVPQGSMTLRGAVLGILGPAVAVAFLIAPLLQGGAPFMGGDTNAILKVLATFAAFGASTAWLYGFLNSGLRLP